MFGEGARRLIDALPDLAGLDRQEVRRLLSAAWLEAVRQRDFEASSASATVARDLRRLATAVETRVFVGTDLSIEARRACAFVAAEALGVVRELSPSDEPDVVAFGSALRFEIVEEALLYLAAGFDANAALAAHAIPPAAAEADIGEWVLDRIRSLVDASTSVPEDRPPEARGVELFVVVRHELWRRIGSLVEAHVRWMRMLSDEDPQAPGELRRLAGVLQDGDRSASHPDLHHLMLLLAEACDGTRARALRRLPAPPGNSTRFAAYQRNRAVARPLLWPAAESYALQALPGPERHAVVAVPTGAGKSSVAELAAAQALHSGWVLYLAPTNALVAQIRRELDRTFRDLGVTVVGLTGRAEYSVLEDDTLAGFSEQIAVMTPEKCSLALRQSPELFESLALCVMDEAHQIGEPGSRGVVAELVLAEILHRAPDVRILLLSALIDSPTQLVDWLQTATGVGAVGIDEPWRPTRTLRALCGVAAEETEDAERLGMAELQKLGPSRKKVRTRIPLRLLGALHGTWTDEDQGDYALVDTGILIDARVERRSGKVEETNHTNPATRALTQHLADAGHRLLVFLPADRNAPFAQAKELVGPGPGPQPPRPEVESLLVLADTEIAGPLSDGVSEVRDALAKGIGIHTSAAMVEEQRASEIAFESGAATVMLATGTLAQGLNLPATAVVIGGTHVGDARDANTVEGQARSKAQLLNAIGRAGRAQTAARSLAIVVPRKPIRIALTPDVRTARRAAPWLADEDGSMVVESQLGGLIRSALSGEFNLPAMDVSEQTAFAFLSFTAESGDATQVLGRTLAAHQAGAVHEAERITETLRILGRGYLEESQSAAWIATAAHRAGVSLPAAVAIERTLRRLLERRHNEPLESLDFWTRALAWMLRAVTPRECEALLGTKILDGTSADGLASLEPMDRKKASQALLRTLRLWLGGAPLIEVGASVRGKPEPIGVTRRGRDDLPKTLRFVRNGIEYALTSVAGAMLATIVTGAETEPEGPWSLEPGEMRELARLPLAMRYGAGDPLVLALMQAGLRPRVVAHLVARLFPPREEVSPDRLARWARQTLRSLNDAHVVEDATTDARERHVLRAAAHVRSIS